MAIDTFAGKAFTAAGLVVALQAIAASHTGPPFGTTAYDH